MAGETGKSPLRHIVLFKVEKKENVPEVVKTLSDMGKELVSGKHVNFINFDVTTDLGVTGVASSNMDVALIGDFPDEESFKTYQKHDLHIAAVAHNKQFVASRTAIQIALPKSSL